MPTGDKPSTHPGVRIHLVGATFTPGQEAAADGALRAYPMLLADRTAGTLRVWRESELDHPMVRSTLMAVQHVIALRHAHQGFKRLRLAPTLQAEKSAWLQQVIGDARLRKLWDALYRDWNVPPKGPAARTRAAINKLICAPDAKLGEAALRKMGTAFNDDAAFFYWAETLARRSSSAAEQAMAAQEGYSGPIVNIRVLEACIADPFNESLLDRFYIDLMVGWREYFWANKMVAWLDTARASEQLLVLCSAGHLRPMRERLLALRPKCGLRMRSL